MAGAGVVSDNVLARPQVHLPRHRSTGPVDGLAAAVGALVGHSGLCDDSSGSPRLAIALGTPVPITHDDVDVLHGRYQNVYGQR